jgi:hypothetical protein
MIKYVFLLVEPWMYIKDTNMYVVERKIICFQSLRCNQPIRLPRPFHVMLQVPHRRRTIITLILRGSAKTSSIKIFIYTVVAQCPYRRRYDHHIHGYTRGSSWTVAVTSPHGTSWPMHDACACGVVAATVQIRCAHIHPATSDLHLRGRGREARRTTPSREATTHRIGVDAHCAVCMPCQPSPRARPIGARQRDGVPSAVRAPCVRNYVPHGARGVATGDQDW